MAIPPTIADWDAGPPDLVAAQRPQDGPDGAGPIEALADRLAAWATDPQGFSGLQQLLAILPAAATALDALQIQLLAGDAVGAAKIARAELARDSDPAMREALRTACAWAIASLDPSASAALFASDTWSPGEALSAASAAAYLALVRSVTPWEAALGRRLMANSDPRIRLAALDIQIVTARRMGIGRSDLRRLVAAAIAQPRTDRRLARGLAELIWVHDTPALVQPLLGRFPGLVAEGIENPMIARLMRRSAWHRVGRAARRETEAAAARLEAVERGAATFWRGLADRALTIAVVGNAPCEIGLGKGAEIDAHDVVVRFNDAPEDGSFASDYGVRCDVKVLAMRNARDPGMTTAAPVVVFRRQAQIAAQNMAFVTAFERQGAGVVYVPTAVTAPLRSRLRSPASTGLAFLAQLRALRGALDGVGCYGFAMTDQLTSGTSSHYFDTTAIVGGHAWAAERALFDAWTAGG